MPNLPSTRILIPHVRPNTMKATMNARIEGLAFNGPEYRRSGSTKALLLRLAEPLQGELDIPRLDFVPAFDLGVVKGLRILLEIFTGDFPGIGQIAGEFHSDVGVTRHGADASRAAWLRGGTPGRAPISGGCSISDSGAWGKRRRRALQNQMIRDKSEIYVTIRARFFVARVIGSHGKRQDDIQENRGRPDC
jgi:hypothetical protein